MIDFTLPKDLKRLRERIRNVVEQEIIPFETDPRWTDHGPTDEMRRDLNKVAREADILAPHVSKQYGGLGLSHVGRAIAFEAAGYSILGPLALNCAAPDEGNMHLMQEVATPEQQARWLGPLARAETRSCFAMTERGGAGSDPELMQTTAWQDGNDYVINGKKWLISGANGAAFVIIMAKIVGGDLDGQATMFLSDMERPGISVDRTLDTLDSSFPGGHCEIGFDNLRIPKSDILGEAGEGFRYAQIRLAPARLTHCMRWLGSAARAHDIARDHAVTRMAFGKPIGEHEGVGFMLADNEMDIEVCRQMIWRTAWMLDQGDQANTQSSMAKVVCSEAIWRIADRCVQILGGLGLTRDTVVERIFREVRSFRVYDGPSEVHRWSLARKCLHNAKGSVGRRV